MATPRKTTTPKPKPQAKAKDKTTDEPTQGWGTPRADKATHYYRNGTSLCGRTSLYQGALLEKATGDPCSSCQSRAVAIGVKS